MVAGQWPGWLARRRPRAVAVLAAAALTPLAALVAIPAQPAAAAAVTPPDMRLQVPRRDISIGINSPTGHRQLQFTHVTWDGGRGPFEIDPIFNSVTGTARFVQAIYNSPKRGVWRFDHFVRLAVTGVFDPPFDYRFPLTRFTLNRVAGDGSAGRVVATSPKTDYCITADTFVGGVPDSPATTFIPQSNCTTPTKPLGWSVGWGDQYDQTDSGQPIDLTGVPNGTYILQGTVDPEHVLTQSNRRNDVVDTLLRIRGHRVTVLRQTMPSVTPPSVTLTRPARGARVSGSVAVAARASAKSPARVRSVQFLLDGHPLGAPDKSSPYARTWRAGRTPLGRHLLSALVTDSRGNMSTAPVRVVTVVSGGARGTVLAATITAPRYPAGWHGGRAAAGSSTLSARPLSARLLSARLLSARLLSARLLSARPLSARPLSARAIRAGGLAAAAALNVTVPARNPAPIAPCFIMQDVSARGQGTVSTRPFHTAAAGETLLAFVSSGGPAGQTVRLSGARLHWSLVRRANSLAGDAEIWQAKAGRVIPAATVTSRQSRPGYRQQLTVIAMQGTGGVGASARASGASAVPSLRLTTTRDISLVFAVGSDQGTAAARWLPAGWVLLRQWLGAGSSWSQYTNVPVPAAGTVVRVRDTGPAGQGWNLAAVELTADGD